MRPCNASHRILGTVSCCGCSSSSEGSAPGPSKRSASRKSGRTEDVSRFRRRSIYPARKGTTLDSSNHHLQEKDFVMGQASGADDPESNREKDVHLFFTASGQLVECTSRGCRPVFSTSAACKGHSTGFLKDMVDYYEAALQNDPHNVSILHKYGKFLCTSLNDYAKGKVMLQQALKIAPHNAEILAEYARLLWEREKDGKNATDVYERAVAADPNNCFVLASYASFLWKTEQNFGLCAHT